VNRIKNGGLSAPTLLMPPDDPDPFGNEHRDDWPACQCGEPLDYVTPNGLCADCAYECVLALEDE